MALSGTDGSIESAGGPAIGWTLPIPPRSERLTLWKQALGDEELAEELARHHRHGAGRIAHLARLAQHQASLRGIEKPSGAEVLAASWTSEGSALESLAEPMRDRIGDEAIVLPPFVRAELEHLLAPLPGPRRAGRTAWALGSGALPARRAGAASSAPRARARRWPPAGSPPGSGMPLYRVDLASVTSKYIGETEKNLAQLLARAEQAEVMLLFDEADSLFGKRTDVKDANDRFANAQTNYLLQRIESFDGIALLTSNSRSRFDAAFTRRLDAIIEFPCPGPEERRALWLSHLGAGHALTPDRDQPARRRRRPRRRPHPQRRVDRGGRRPGRRAPICLRRPRRRSGRRVPQAGQAASPLARAGPAGVDRCGWATSRLRGWSGSREGLPPERPRSRPPTSKSRPLPEFLSSFNGSVPGSPCRRAPRTRRT